MKVSPYITCKTFVAAGLFLLALFPYRTQILHTFRGFWVEPECTECKILAAGRCGAEGVPETATVVLNIDSAKPTKTYYLLAHALAPRRVLTADHVDACQDRAVPCPYILNYHDGDECLH